MSFAALGSKLGSFFTGDLFGDLFSGAGSGLLSGLLGSVSSSHAAKKAYKYALALQDHQNAFTERMANTAHQREVKDLLQAGLNPILSATGGSGAATPAAGSASQSPVDPHLEQAVATALDAKRLRNETKLRESQEELNTSQWFLNRGQEASAREQGNYIRTQNSLLEKYGPDKYMAEIADLASQIKARNSVTAKQLKVLDAQEWRLRHQALGFSESHSESTSSDYTPLRNDLGGFGFHFSNYNDYQTNNKFSRSYTRSRTY